MDQVVMLSRVKSYLILSLQEGNVQPTAKRDITDSLCRSFLHPLTRQPFYARWSYLPPFAIHGTHRITKEEITLMGQLYRNILDKFVKGDFSVEEIKKYSYMNDWIVSVTN